METLKQVAGIVIAGHIAPYLSGVLPKDFPKRLERLWEASGLTWNAFADALGVDKKRVHRWRRGVKPDGDGYHALVKLAALIPGGPRHPHGGRIPDVPLAGLAGPARPAGRPAGLTPS